MANLFGKFTPYSNSWGCQAMFELRGFSLKYFFFLRRLDCSSSKEMLASEWTHSWGIHCSSRLVSCGLCEVCRKWWTSAGWFLDVLGMCIASFFSQAVTDLDTFPACARSLKETVPYLTFGYWARLYWLIAFLSSAIH